MDLYSFDFRLCLADLIEIHFVYRLQFGWRVFSEAILILAWRLSYYVISFDNNTKMNGQTKCDLNWRE